MSRDGRDGVGGVGRAVAEIRLLTPLGAGAVAVVQVVGTGALAIAEGGVRGRRGRLGAVAAGRVIYGDFVDEAGEAFDDGLAVWGERAGVAWVEFNLHGGVRIVQKVIQRAEGLGAVLAPTKREGLRADEPLSCGDAGFAWLRPLDRWMQECLNEASTQRVVRWLAGQPGKWRERIEKWIGRIEQGKLAGVADEVESLVREAATVGRAWRGRTIAIIGPANVGKSTLANRLAGRDISLVADAPGTTRDWVGEPIAVQGWPVTIIDTAGLRTSEDALEAEGVVRARERAEQADVRLVVFDVASYSEQPVSMLLDRCSLKTYDIVAYNKCDLPHRRPAAGRETGLAEKQDVFVSSLTGQGWAVLEDAILTACGFLSLHEPKPLVFCAELQDRLDDVVSSLRSERASGARTCLEAL